MARKRLGSLYVGQQRLDEALSQFQELEKTEADAQETRVKIGLIYVEKGEYERAATEFTLVLAADPNNARVRYYLGSVCAEMKDYDGAVAEFQQILNTYSPCPYDDEVRLKIALSYYKDSPGYALDQTETTVTAGQALNLYFTYLSDTTWTVLAYELRITPAIVAWAFGLAALASASPARSSPPAVPPAPASSKPSAAPDRAVLAQCSAPTGQHPHSRPDTSKMAGRASSALVTQATVKNKAAKANNSRNRGAFCVRW